MASQTFFEIQQHLAEYLAGRTKLHEFEDWFVPVLWDLAEGPDASARELAGRIHILIAEASRGDRTAQSLRQELTALQHPSDRKILSVDGEDHPSFPFQSEPSSPYSIAASPQFIPNEESNWLIGALAFGSQDACTIQNRGA